MNTFQFSLTAFLVASLPLNLVYAKPPIEVIAYTASIESKPQNIHALGLLKATESIEITSNVTDTIQKMHFKSGDKVQKGQLLLELNNREELAQLQEAKALEQESYSQYQRFRKAIKSNTVTQSMVDEKYREWQTAIAKRKVTEATLENFKLSAPFDGQLGFTDYAEGAILSAGQPLISLDNTEKMRLDLFVPIRFLEFLQPGLSVSASSTAYPQKSFSGKISAVSPRLQNMVRLVQVQAEIDNPQGLLKTNMMVNAQIALPNKSQLTIPNTAILMLGDYEFAYRLAKTEDGNYKAEKVTLETGDIGASNTEILSGLAEGDIVVSQGVMRVNSKTPVKIKAMQNNTEQAQLLRPTAKNTQVKGQ